MAANEEESSIPAPPLMPSSANVPNTDRSLLAARGRAAGAAQHGGFAKLKGYVALMKLRIIELLLITTLPTMILAARGWPGWSLSALTLVGGTLAAGAANAWNMIFDRDIDAVMNRTKTRPLVTGVLSVREAAVFSALLTGLSVFWFAAFVNWVSAALVIGAILIYVVGYTLILKRRTPQNIVWGGIAGCMPVLIGWSAVTNSLALPPFILFLVVFFWTPPHYWPLSIKFEKDYRKAGVPMAPVVQATTTVAWHMIVHTVAMVACTLVLIPVAQLGWIYTVTAALAGGWFLWATVNLYRRARTESGPLAAMRVFHGSIYYLSAIFLAVGLDPFGPTLGL